MKLKLLTFEQAFKYYCNKWYKHRSSDSFIVAEEGEIVYSKELKRPTESAIKIALCYKGPKMLQSIPTSVCSLSDARINLSPNYL